MAQFTLAYRPRKISEVVGQAPTMLAISKLLRLYEATGEFPRSLIFQGAYGCGKTTMGRILARYINCEQGPLRACGVCESCLSMDRGNNPDIWEVDAASHNKVSDVPIFKEWCQFATKRRKKILILDEAHRMSKEAMDSMLKIVEEGEENVCFVFCTTEDDKMPYTIKSRSTVLPVGLLKPKELSDLAHSILTKEGIRVESEEALQHLVRKSGGHARDLVKQLEAAVKYYSDQENFISDEAIYLMSEMTSVKEANAFIYGALTHNEGAVYQAIQDATLDPSGFCKTVIEILCNELHYRAMLSGGAELKAIKAEDIVRFLAMLEDTRGRVKMGDSITTLLIGYERWKLGAYVEI